MEIIWLLKHTYSYISSIGWLGKKQKCWRKAGATESRFESSKKGECKSKKADQMRGNDGTHN